MLDPVTLPMTNKALRVFGAPMIVAPPNASTGRYLYLCDGPTGWLRVACEALPGVVGIFPVEWCHIDLTHPEGERIAQLVAHGP